MQRKQHVLYTILLLALPFSTKGAHLVGGEIYYECLGNNEYRITLKVYRDCNSDGAPFDSPASIAVYNAQGTLEQTLNAYHDGAQQLPVIINNPCLQAPPDICVQEAVYTVTATLPPIAGGYHIAYQRCCRNQSILNLTNPSTQGSTYHVTIPETALNTCNSSPYFDNFPPLALCIGDELVFDHSATDPDSDQLVYSLCTPFHGGTQANPAPIPANAPPYATISWGSGYNANNPIDASPALSIDPVSGLLTGTPTQAGQYVVGVCVEEYRDGVLISTNKRDFQFNVVNCLSTVEAVIPAQADFHDSCSGLTVFFGNLSINTQYYHWDFGVDYLLNDTSDLRNPTYTFPDTGTYQVTLIGNPGYACADTTVRSIEVYEGVEIEINSTGNPCADANMFDFQVSGQYANNASFLWEFAHANIATSNQANPTGIVFDSVGTYTISVTVSDNHCSGQASTEVTTLPRPLAAFSLDTLRGCAPLGILLLDESISATEYQRFWNLGDGTTSTDHRVLHSYTSSGVFDVSLTVWTSEGCIDTSTHTLQQIVEVLPVPDGSLWVDTHIQFIFEPHFNFEGSSNQAVTCSLATGDGAQFSSTLADCTYQYTYSDTGSYQAVMTFIDANGCHTRDTAFLRVEPEVRFWLPNAFTPNNDRVNDTWGPIAFGFKEYEMWVYDRWGQLMFHSTDPTEKWNGTPHNKGNHKPIPGVYSYRVWAVAVKHRIIKESGHVTILK